jgi:hypothetical protein
MRRVWDAGWYPQPASYDNISQPWDPKTQGWTREWLRELLDLTNRTIEEVSQLRRSEIEAAAQRRRQEAIERFWGGGELRRLLHPTLPTLHTPALCARLPNTFVVSGEAGQLVRFQSWLEGRGLASKVKILSEERIEVSTLLPLEISCTLTLVLDCGLQQCECTANTQVVSTVRDRLSVIEHALAVEGLARKCLCPDCTHQALMPVTMERDGGRHMSIWCSICSSFVEPVVDPADYVQLSFLPRGAAVTRIPTVLVNRPITRPRDLIVSHLNS